METVCIARQPIVDEPVKKTRVLPFLPAPCRKKTFIFNILKIAACAGRTRLEAFYEISIVDRHKAIYAYETLFRHGTANTVSDIDGNGATHPLLANTFSTIGMDTLAGGEKSSSMVPRTAGKKRPCCCPKKQW